MAADIPGVPPDLTVDELAEAERMERERPFLTVFPSLALQGMRTWADYMRLSAWRPRDEASAESGVALADEE